MNRQQKRKHKKQQKMNSQQKRIKNMRREENAIQREGTMYKKMRDEGIHKAIDIIQPLMFYSMHKALDMKSPSIAKVADTFNKLVAKIAEGKMSVDAVMDDLTYKTGIEFLKDSDEWYFPNRRPKREVVEEDAK